MSRYSFAGNIMSRVHRLPRTGEAVLPGRLHDADGRHPPQLPARRLHADHDAPPRRGAVPRGHPDGRQRRAEDTRCTTGATPAGSATRSTGATRSSWCRRFLYELYGDTPTMSHLLRPDGRLRRLHPAAEGRHRRDAHIVDAALADWVSAEPTSGPDHRHLGLLRDDHARWRRWPRSPATTADAAAYTALAAEIKAAFNRAFYNDTLRPLHRHRERRHRRRHPDRAGARARRRARARRTNAAGRPRRARRAHLRVPPQRRRPALQRRHHRHGADRAGAGRRRPRRRALGPAAGGRPAELRLLPGSPRRRTPAASPPSASAGTGATRRTT